MSTNEELKFKTLIAARDNGIESILFRNSLIKKQGLTLTESLCLTLLGINKVSTPKELSKYTGLTTGATTTMLDRLVAKGFVIRKSNPNDRRGVLIEINPKHNDTSFKLVAGIQKAHKELIESYSDKDLEVIIDFLNKLTKNMSIEAEKLDS